MTNINNRALYIGVTNNLVRRIYEHKNHFSNKAFTTRYNVNKLVYYEVFENIEDAILREKQIKSGSRERKLQLIEKNNPEFNDLYLSLIK